MAKEKLPPDVASLRKAVARFTEQPDRGTALVAAAWLDDALETRIRSALRPDKRVADDIFRGPLGTFSARIKLAYLFDLIEPTARKDLDTIRAIRNQFAHTRDDLRFSSATVRDRCQKLHGAEACRLGGWTLRSPRQKFVVTAYFLAEYLMSLTEPRERHALLEHADSYGTWIRRTVKSTALGLLAKQVRTL